MQWRKAEAETGEFAAVREAIHYLSGEGENRQRKGQVDGQTGGQVEKDETRGEKLSAFLIFPGLDLNITGKKGQSVDLLCDWF